MQNNEEITIEIVQQYNMIFPMLKGILEEMRELSKKKQDGVLNPLKAKTINRILVKAKDLVKDEPSNEFLDLLDEETLPTNSDAVLLIVQFKSALEAFKTKYSKSDANRRTWQS